MIDYDNVTWNIDILDGMLIERRWHGENVIWPGKPGTPSSLTVRGAFSDVQRDVLRLLADNRRLYDNETEALDRMKRAETKLCFALEKLARRNDEIDRLKTALAAARDPSVPKAAWSISIDTNPEAPTP